MKRQACVFSRRRPFGQNDSDYVPQSITVGTNFRTDSNSSVDISGPQIAQQSDLVNPITPSSLGDLHSANIGPTEQLQGTTFEPPPLTSTTSLSQQLRGSDQETLIMDLWSEALPEFPDADPGFDMWSTTGAVCDLPEPWGFEPILLDY